MVINVYLKSGQTIHLTAVEDFKWEKRGAELSSYEFTWKAGATNKTLFLPIDSIAAIARES